ncbi:hypothetical protein GOBAR_AA27226 [Gossypium barbadense]|uniref:DUF4283 domain-containing protein n=1 Tax=Gossypium barbadense TaxID=3634 RepID=A0A2P5WQQ7_GOSBA|nr:hypothetical protein GOBAR_AA27226 [Gossypium barbadense]
MDRIINAPVTVVLKLFGRNIRYSALNNRISSVWYPSKPFHLMDIENGYFLAKFQSIDDFVKVLPQGPWMISGQYLTVQRWIKEFNPLQPYSSMVLAWIRLPGLPGLYWWNRQPSEIIGKVVWLDFNIDSRTRGRFARIAVYINLDKPLIAQVLVNGMNQRVEYEALPTIYFTCEKYGHTKELCALLQSDLARRRTREKGKTGSSFDALANMEAGGDKLGIGPLDLQKVGPVANISVGQSIGTIGYTTRTVSPLFSKNDLDHSNNGVLQINNVVGPDCTDPVPLINETWSSNPSNDSEFKISSGDEFFKMHDNNSNSMPVTISCINPIFVDQGANVDDGPIMSSKPAYSVSKLVEVRVVDFFGGLNLNKHTVVSFKKKGPTDGIHLERCSVHNSGVNKI